MAGPPPRYLNERDTRLLRQQRHREMADAAAADRGIADRGWPCFGGCDYIGKGLERLLRTGRKHIGRSTDQQYGIEIPLGIVRQIGQHKWICRVVVEHDEPIAAVRWRLCHRGRANASGSSCPVFDDQGGPKPLLQAVLHEPGDHVG
jgi:hypothetical protein